jgi:hypothetical protein
MLSRRNYTASETISTSNETEILTFLIESISSLLTGFAFPPEKLEEQLASGVYELGSNAWSAAHVSLGEQRVLRLTKKRVETLLSMAEGGVDEAQAHCAKCKQASSQLMRCGRCSKVMYCGRACQVAHYKEHKGLCRAQVA